MFVNLKEDTQMTQNEIELINIIRNSPNPAETFEKALRLFIADLNHHEEEQGTPSDVRVESA